MQKYGSLGDAYGFGKTATLILKAKENAMTNATYKVSRIDDKWVLFRRCDKELNKIASFPKRKTAMKIYKKLINQPKKEMKL